MRIQRRNLARVGTAALQIQSAARDRRHPAVQRERQGRRRRLDPGASLLPADDGRPEGGATRDRHRLRRRPPDLPRCWALAFVQLTTADDLNVTDEHDSGRSFTSMSNIAMSLATWNFNEQHPNTARHMIDTFADRASIRVDLSFHIARTDDTSPCGFHARR
jgi:hypothetical protein